MLKGKRLNFKVYDTLDSTNCECKRLALTNAKATWILARQQTNGRGRVGKVWHSLTSNFFASYLFYPKIKERDLPLYSFVAGISFYDSVALISVKEDLTQLKWPNDLLMNRKKIGGILIESCKIPCKSDNALIIGFGLNLVSCPSQSCLEFGAIPADYLRSRVSKLPTTIEFLKILMPQFDKWNRIFLEKGFDIIREEFLKRSFPIGEKISVKSKNKVTEGTFLGLNNDGSLILNSCMGQISVSTGDISLVGN